MLLPPLQPCDQLGDRLRLIPPRLKPADQMKRPHALPPRMPILSQFPGDGKPAKPKAPPLIVTATKCAYLNRRFAVHTEFT